MLMVAVAVVCLMLPTLTSETTGSGGSVVKVSVTETANSEVNDTSTSYSVSWDQPAEIYRRICCCAVVVNVLLQSPCGVVR